MEKFPKKKYSKLSSYFDDYTEKVFDNLEKISKTNFNEVVNLIEKKILRNSNIFLCGNGGSAAIANHYICDFLKVLRTGTNFKPKFFSLISNIELISAISNDLNYGEIFKYQLESLAKKDDLVIFVSSSGNSLNIKKALDYCKKMKISSIGFCGFDGGYLKKNCTVPMHVNINNYGIVEDIHHTLMHIMLQFLRQKYFSKKNIIKLKF
jgi:D-sedoheptulose 7-phosphate isomerase